MSLTGLFGAIVKRVGSSNASVQVLQNRDDLNSSVTITLNFLAIALKTKLVGADLSPLAVAEKRAHP